jgi:hydrogenase-4 component B
MEAMPTLLLEIALALYLGGTMASLLCIRHDIAALRLGFGASAAASTVGLVAAVWALAARESAPTILLPVLPDMLPYLTCSARLDALGSFFVMLVSLLGLSLSVYSFGYAATFLGRKSVALLAAGFNTLLLATTLVCVAENALFFLVVWELMAMTAFFLVSYEHEQAGTRQAGVLYFVMSHVGAACLIAGFLLLFQVSGGLGFIGFHGAGERLTATSRNAAFLLFLVGFGIKAGIVPLHTWLPAAHPVAPSNISALLSAVLIKTGIYGLCRVCFDFLGTPPMWWGALILALGTVSAVLGVLYALMEHDLKRLLAYHSIENIGIILMGLGASLMFLHTGHPVLAAMGLLAALYHTINHATFKGLLFLGAGAILHATHTRNLEEMGGLIKRMPRTAFLFLLGAVAISALPPLNGFVSEWLTYQTLLQGFGTTTTLVRLAFPLAAAMLALTGALAAACFVKAFGIAFLGQARSEAAAHAREASRPMLAGMAILGVACVLLGLMPTVVVRLLDPVCLSLIGEPLHERLSLANGLVLASLGPKPGTVSTAGIALMAVCLLPIPWALWWWFGRGAALRIGPTWDCGLKGLTPQMQYSATGFSKPLRMIFQALFRPRREVQREYDYSPYFAKSLRFESHIEEAFERRIYRPINWLVLRISRRMRKVQAGSIQAYLFYIFVTLLVLLLVAL